MLGPKNKKNNTIRASKKEKNGPLIRKIRLICSDPNATNLSSGNELKHVSQRRLVREIHMHKNLVQTEVQIQTEEDHIIFSAVASIVS